MAIGGSLRTGRRFVEIQGAIFAFVGIITGYVAGEFRTGDFFVECLDETLLHHFAASAVNRVRNIGIQFCPAVVLADNAIGGKFAAALVAVEGPQVIFGAAMGAAGSQFSAGHSNERPICSFNDFKITNDKGGIECYGAKRPEPFTRLVH